MLWQFLKRKIYKFVINRELCHNNLDYNVFRIDRTLKGGGVMLLVEKLLKVTFFATTKKVKVFGQCK